MNTQVNALLPILSAVVIGSFATADIPRTAEGKPDMSGTYNVGTSTSMQRNRIFGDNRYMTEEQNDMPVQPNRSCKAEQKAILIGKRHPKAAMAHLALPAMSVDTTPFGFHEMAPHRSAR